MYERRLVAILLLSAVMVGQWIPSASGSEPPDKPQMVYFYNTSCRLCTGVTEAVTTAEKKYAGTLESTRFNLTDTAKNIEYLNYLYILLDEMGVPEDTTPTLVVFLGTMEEKVEGKTFVPKRVLLEEDIKDKLDKEIDDFLANPVARQHTAHIFTRSVLRNLLPSFVAHAAEPSSIRPPVQRQPSQRAQARAQERVRFGAISAAALADSVNPCAFATIIILVAMMSSAKRTKNEIIAVCLSFTAAVYMTYFAIGLFLYKVIAEINARGGWYLVVADLVNYGAFFLCVIFAILTFRDFYMLYKGRSAEEMTLQLPKAFKKRINVAMAKGVRAQWLVVGVFIAGVSVSFLEAACTGQVYLTC